MESEVTVLSPVEKELLVRIPWETLAPDLKARIDKAAKSARIKGFRPGRAPRHIVEKVHGPRIEMELANEWLNKGTFEACDKHALRPVSRPTVDIKTFKAGEPFEFTAKLEVIPDIEALNLQDISLEIPFVTPDPDVVEESIQDKLKALQTSHKVTSALESPRPAASGDEVRFAFIGLVDGEEDERLKADDQTAYLDGKGLRPEFESALVGMNVDETKSVMLPFDEDDRNEWLRGKTVEFRLTLKEIWDVSLPDIDDELAKDAGFETQEALDKFLRDEAAQRIEKDRDGAVRIALCEELVRRHPIEVPESLVREESNELQYMRRMQMISAIRAGTASMEALQEEVSAESVREDAVKRVQIAVIFQEIAKQKELKISDEDMEAYFAGVAEKQQKPVAWVKAQLDDAKTQELRNTLLEKKLVASILEGARIQESAEAAAKAEKETAELSQLG